MEERLLGKGGEEAGSLAVSAWSKQEPRNESETHGGGDGVRQKLRLRQEYIIEEVLICNLALQKHVILITVGGEWEVTEGFKQACLI